MDADPLNRGFAVVPQPLEKPDTFRPLSKKVMLILPAYKSYHPITTLCIAQLNDRRRVGMLLSYDDAFVAHARNTCAREFLKTDSEWALWIDDDMLVPCGNSAWFKAHTRWRNLPDSFAGLNAIDRLLSHGKTLVGGLYFGRHPGANAVYGEALGNAKESDYARTLQSEVKPTSWVGFGCCLTHRSVFESITARHPELNGQWFSSSEHSLVSDVNRARAMLADGPMTGEKALKAYEILEGAAKRSQAVSGLGTGEDVIFCRRAGESGHQPHVDLGLVCGHIGSSCFPTGVWR